MTQKNRQEIRTIELNSSEKSVYQIASTDAMTGDNYKSRYLYYQLKMSIARADRIDIIVSFLMESGVRMLLKDLKKALDRGVHIRLLTGNYLGITQPSALYLIKKELGNRIDLRFYSETNRSFHPKAYIFHRGTESELYIGSSNISRSALTSGIEWNYKVNSQLDRKSYETFFNTFEDLLAHHSIVIDDHVLEKYTKNWRKPAVAKDLEKYDHWESSKYGIEQLFQPRGAQIEALYALQNSRDEGADRGLIYAATGIGKTYIAAFDSMNYKKILFVAHLDEILT